MITYDEHGCAIVTFKKEDQRGIELAAVARMHLWEPVHDIIGAKRCRRCGMTRFKIPGRKGHLRQGRCSG